MRKQLINCETSIKTHPWYQRASLGISRMGLGSHLCPGSCSSQHTMYGLPGGSCSWLIPPGLPSHIALLHFSPLLHCTLSSRCLQSLASPHSPSAQDSSCGFNKCITYYCGTLVSPTRCTCLRTGTQEWQQRCSSGRCSAPLTVSPGSEGTHNTNQSGFLKGPFSQHLV